MKNGVDAFSVLGVEVEVAVSEALQALCLIGEGGLSPRLAVNGGVHLIITRVYGGVIRQQGGNVDAANFLEQVAEMGANLIRLQPAVICGWLTAKVVYNIGPSVNPRRLFQAQLHRGRVEFGQLGQLGINSEIGAARPITQDKGMTLQQGVKYL